MEVRDNKVIMDPVKGKKYFYSYPQLVVVIGVRDGDKLNFMPCVWNTGLSYDPFLYGVSVGTERFTRKMLSNVNEYTINFLRFEDVELVRSLGRSSGGQLDKIKELNKSYKESAKINAPLLENAYYSLECTKYAEKLFGDHVLFVGEVVLMHINESLMKNYILDTKKVSPILYLGVDHYIKIDSDSLQSLKDLPFHYEKK